MKRALYILMLSSVVATSYGAISFQRKTTLAEIAQEFRAQMPQKRQLAQLARLLKNTEFSLDDIKLVYPYFTDEQATVMLEIRKAAAEVIANQLLEEEGL